MFCGNRSGMTAFARWSADRHEYHATTLLGSEVCSGIKTAELLTGRQDLVEHRGYNKPIDATT
jgi:hypothetical protein